MPINRRCPKCGGTHVQLSNETSKHGCIWTVLFGIYYICWLMIRWIVGMMIFLCYDWWAAIVHAACGKGHVWQSARWFSNRRRVFYCHDCGYNFRV